MKPLSSKERVQAVLSGLPVDRTPVTPIFMAWAAHHIGRTYRDYYLDGEVLVQSQLAVAREFGFDQVSAISDPWRESSGYGMEFDYPQEGVGKPKDHLIKSPEDVARLRRIDISQSPRMQQRVDSVARMAAEVGKTHSILGWVEGPIAQYSDMRDLQTTMMDLFDKPEMFQEAAKVIVENAIAFAVAQVRAGADMIGVGDAAASLIGPEFYRTLVLPWQQKLFAAIHEAGAKVKLHICGNINAIIADMAQSGADVIDVDWMVPLDKARQAVGEKVVLCGNIDPSALVLQGTPEKIAAAKKECLASAGRAFCFMPGCEVPAGTPVENVRALR